LLRGYFEEESVEEQEGCVGADDPQPAAIPREREPVSANGLRISSLPLQVCDEAAV